jgi:hypothetical protein
VTGHSLPMRFMEQRNRCLHWSHCQPKGTDPIRIQCRPDRPGSRSPPLITELKVLTLRADGTPTTPEGRHSRPTAAINPTPQQTARALIAEHDRDWDPMVDPDMVQSPLWQRFSFSIASSIDRSMFMNLGSRVRDVLGHRSGHTPANLPGCGHRKGRGVSEAGTGNDGDL